MTLIFAQCVNIELLLNKSNLCNFALQAGGRYKKNINLVLRRERDKKLDLRSKHLAT